MAYSTGTIASAADLVGVIFTFAVANGWTQNGSILTKGGCAVRITSPNTSEVRIEGARNGNFAAPDLCSRYSKIYLTNWPASASYHLAAFSSPDTVWVTINYDVTDHAHMGFGNVEKYGNWAGGQWFHAQHTNDASSKDNNLFSHVDGYRLPIFNGNGRECALFWSQRDDDSWGNSGVFPGKVSFLHCELRGYVWEASEYVNSELHIVHCPTIIGPAHKYSPNAFNGQTVLSPFQLFLQNTDGHYMGVGHVGHLRWLKLTNYNPGDILEIGGERWKVFPWHRLDPTKPDGKEAQYNDGSQSTGLLGVAVRYDGP